MDQFVTLVTQHAWWALAAFCIGGIVRLLKADTPLPFSVPPRARAWLAIGLGIVAGVCDKIAQGTSWQEALMGGLAAALAAIAGHDTIVEGLRGGREFFSKRPPAPPSKAPYDPTREGPDGQPIPPYSTRNRIDGRVRRGAAVLSMVALTGCAWLTPKHANDIAAIVTCVLDESSELTESPPTLADAAKIAGNCGAADAQDVIDLVTAHKAAEALESRRLAARAGREGGAP